MEETYPQYRIITFNLTIRTEDLPKVEEILTKDDWELQPTRLDEENSVIFPKTTDGMHRKSMQIFREIAPYILGHAILEETSQEGVRWLHLLYEKIHTQSTRLREVRTPTYTYQI